MHSTDNLNDDYFGSGHVLWRSIKKYGKENHKCEILEHLFDRQSLKLREREIVNEEVLGDKLCMNLRLGGEGWESEEASKAAILGNKSIRRDHVEIAIKSLRTKTINNSFNRKQWGNWNGRSHTDETKLKIGKANSIAQKGIGNSQFGKMWIYNESLKLSKSISNDLLEEFLIDGWKVGRKMKFK
jgi:hypothetical protein